MKLWGYHSYTKPIDERTYTRHSYNTASTYAPHPSPASPSWLTSHFDWGAENNISFHTGGLIHLCGEVTLNTWIQTLPPGLQSRSFYNDVETYADLRVWKQSHNGSLDLARYTPHIRHTCCNNWSVLGERDPQPGPPNTSSRSTLPGRQRNLAQ